MSIAKMSLCANMRATTEFMSHVLGPKLIADSGEWGTYAWSQYVLGEPAMHIAGGPTRCSATSSGSGCSA